MRYKKVVNGTTTEYYYNGTQLLAEYNRTTKEMKYYFYDQTGIAGMIYNGSYYYFDKNTLGDVIAVRDAYGYVIAKYKYDAWGNILEESDPYNSGIASKNPFRYRGYYYDSETGFYYLQTRYYDPEIGRFINADDYELVGTLASVPGQLNMYAYCGNNPVMYTDPSGEIVISAGMILGGLGLFLLAELFYIEATTNVISEALNFLTNSIYTAADSLISNISVKKKSKKSKNKNPDPYARPGQKKQGRERKNKSRLNSNFEQRNGRRRGPQPLKHHTPGRDHRKYLLFLFCGRELILDNWLED